MAETQSFVLQARGRLSGFSDGHIMNPAQGFDSESSVEEGSEKSVRGVSFQLGLSDSSHLQDRAQALAMESTQAFVPVDDTGAHAATSHPERVASDNGLSEDATQAYVEDEEPSRCPVTTRQEGQVDLALEATQAYISDLCNDSEDETDEDETKNIACVETQAFELPTSSTLAMAETLPMCVLEEEGSLSDTEDGKAVPSLDEAQTQAMPLSDNEEINDEDSVPVLRKRKAKPLHFEDEQTQPLASSELALVETQPVLLAIDETIDTSENDDDDEEDSIPVSRRKKTKPLQIQDEETQTLTGSDVTVETQPVVTGHCEDEESDDEGSIIGLRKRKAKPLQTQEEESQTLSLTAGETQPAVTDEDGESDDVFPNLHKRKARPLQIQEESQSLSHSEVSTSETQLSETNTVCQKGHGGQTDAENSGVTGSSGARARLRTEEELTECAESPKRQMREKTKSTEKSRPCENESGEEEEGEQKKQAGGESEKKNDEEEENKPSQNGSLVKEQEAIPEQEDVSDLRQKTERTDEEKRQMDESEKKLESQQRREEEEKLKKEEREEKMVAEHAEGSKREMERAEKETIERKRKEEEDKERAERTKREKEEQLLRNKKEKEDKERLELEKAEREQKERLEREEKARLESQRKEKEEKDRLQAEKRKQEETLEREEEEPKPQVSLQSEAKAQEGGGCSEREKQEKDEKAIEERQENKPSVPPRGRRAARRTVAALCTAEPQQDSTNDDVPARRTRSRSNSSNSVSSERSAASLDSQQSKGRGRGRGRGRGAKRTSEPPSAVTPRSSSRRKTVAARPAEQDGSDISQGAVSRSNFSNSINSDLSISSLSSRGRGRGGRQHARGRQAEANSATLISNQGDQSPAPKPQGRNRRSNKAEESSINASCGEDEDKTGSQQAATTRGRWRASSDGSEPASNENPLHQDESGANKSSPAPKRNIRARSQKEMKSETTEAEVSPSGSHEAEAGEKRRGRKRVSEANTEEAASSKISKGTVREQTVAEEDEEAKGQPQDEIPIQANRGGRAAISQTKRGAKGAPAEAEVKKDDVRTEEAAVGRRVRGRSSVAHQKKKDEQEGSNSSVDQGARAVKPEVTR